MDNTRFTEERSWLQTRVADDQDLFRLLEAVEDVAEPTEASGSVERLPYGLPPKNAKKRWGSRRLGLPVSGQ
jgi:hypothetical protein